MEETTKISKIYKTPADVFEEWERMRLIYDAALREVNTKLEILNNEFKMAHQYNPIEHITSRIKSPESIAKKLKHNEREVTMENIIKYINDVAGIRIICSFTSDIYRIASLIAKQSDVTVLKVKDYIENPKENGYKSYHMIVPIWLHSLTRRCLQSMRKSAFIQGKKRQKTVKWTLD